ncbi:hypothetical protein AVEN_165027-1 [Araneus ventricosus]|uniref:Reverse transcriptase domain-containing protein n=1 Tax=Araneus ventricosus TaxID=182803 RepID=A0A4Y2GKS8_ARAVE|nr:hypothetical protein AVEN_165027-1 [Araneus ventricosus]
MKSATMMPQGSCTGPDFWNLMSHEVIWQNWSQEVHLQAFEDDFVSVVNAGTKQELSVTLEEQLLSFLASQMRYKYRWSVLSFLLSFRSKG